MADQAVTEHGTQQSRSIRLTGVRRMIADRMSLSHREIPGVHVIEELDLTDVPLSRVVAIAARAIGQVIRDYPALNAHLEDNELTCYDRCDVGIAVDTDRGLMVPVVRDCAGKGIVEIKDDLDMLAARARQGALSREDVSGATITITSPGKRGGVLATPLINPPQTAIIGIHRAVPRLVLREGEPVNRLIANLTVTFDHRVIDGATAGEFALALARLIEHGADADVPHQSSRRQVS